MLAYCIFYNDNEVGRIYEKDGKYKYLPSKLELENMQNIPDIIFEEQLKWGELPEFFKNMIAKDPECLNTFKGMKEGIRISKNKVK